MNTPPPKQALRRGFLMYRTQKKERLTLAELTQRRSIYAQPLYPIGFSFGTSFFIKRSMFVDETAERNLM
jgi:hypothetical protein